VSVEAGALEHRERGCDKGEPTNEADASMIELPEVVAKANA
jgi:hypothetical protein